MATPARASPTVDVRALIGDPKALDRDLQRFRRSASLISQNQPRLVDTYGNMWVAFYEGEVQAAAKTLRSLLMEVDNRKLPRGQIIVRYMEEPPRTLIL